MKINHFAQSRMPSLPVHSWPQGKIISGQFENSWPNRQFSISKLKAAINKRALVSKIHFKKEINRYKPMVTKLIIWMEGVQRKEKAKSRTDYHYHLNFFPFNGWTKASLIGCFWNESGGGGEKNESTCHLFIEKSERYKKRLPPFVKKHKDFL